MSEQMVFDENGEYKFEEREPIKGFPELRWTGKRPFNDVLPCTTERKLRCRC